MTQPPADAATTLHLFVKQYRRLREQQKGVFKTRNPLVLNECKRQEKELDAWAAELLGAGPPTLFDAIDEIEPGGE